MVNDLSAILSVILGATRGGDALHAVGLSALQELLKFGLGYHRC